METEGDGAPSPGVWGTVRGRERSEYTDITVDRTIHSLFFKRYVCALRKEIHMMMFIGRPGVT